MFNKNELQLHWYNHIYLRSQDKWYCNNDVFSQLPKKITSSNYYSNLCNKDLIKFDIM